MGRRDLRLDVLRGVAAVAMIVDHIGGGRSWLYGVTGGDRFYFSGAETFVLISGITAGLVYGRVLVQQGVRAAARKVAQRVGQLYLLTVILTLLFGAGGQIAGAPWRPDLARADVPGWVLSVITMQRTFYLADILLMYVFLMAALLPILVGLSRGRTRLVVGASYGLWLLWQIAPRWANLPWPIANNTMFHLAAWQLIFTAGVAIGFHAPRIRAWAGDRWPRVVFATSGLIAMALLALYAWQSGAGGALDPATDLGRQFADKADVGLGRLIALAAFFALGYSGLTLVWARAAAVVRWLLPLGQHALTAYAVHLGIVAMWASVFPTWDVPRSASQTAVIQTIALLGVWGIVVLNAERASVPAILRLSRSPRPRRR